MKRLALLLQITALTLLVACDPSVPLSLEDLLPAKNGTLQGLESNQQQVLEVTADSGLKSSCPRAIYFVLKMDDEKKIESLSVCNAKNNLPVNCDVYSASKLKRGIVLAEKDVRGTDVDIITMSSSTGFNTTDGGKIKIKYMYDVSLSLTGATPKFTKEYIYLRKTGNQWAMHTKPLKVDLSGMSEWDRMVWRARRGSKDIFKGMKLIANHRKITFVGRILVGIKNLEKY